MDAPALTQICSGICAAARTQHGHPLFGSALAFCRDWAESYCWCRLLLHGRVCAAALWARRVPAAAGDAVRARVWPRAAGAAPRQAQPACVRVRRAQAGAPAGRRRARAAAHLRHRVRPSAFRCPGGHAVPHAACDAATASHSLPRVCVDEHCWALPRRDNPASDVRGANAAGGPWRSVLVRTGVFHGVGNDAGAPPASDLGARM